MRIYEEQNYEAMSRRAANIISAQIILKPSCVLGLATGSTPIGIYKQLIEWNKKGDLSFSEVRTVNLDEYVGLSGTNPQSYRYFMQKNFFDKIDIKQSNTSIPNGKAEDLEKECKCFTKHINSLGGIDLQLLGLGHNGHIGFNEPSKYFPLNTHVVKLTNSTIEANKRFFGEKESVPSSAITMGIKDILSAKHILLVVSGKDKSEIVKKTFTSEVTPEIPSTILQLHNNVTLVGDKDALSELMEVL